MKAIRLLLVAAIGLSAASAWARTWTDNLGNKVQAKFVRYFDGDVVLLRGTKVVKVRFHTLSEDDQEYIRKQLEAKGQADLLPPRHEAGRELAKGRLPVPGPERTWTSTDGKEIQAKLLGVSGGKITILFKGREVSVPLTRLCADDQQYVAMYLIEQLAKQQRNVQPADNNPPPAMAQSPRQFQRSPRMSTSPMNTPRVVVSQTDSQPQTFPAISTSTAEPSTAPTSTFQPQESRATHHFHFPEPTPLPTSPTPSPNDVAPSQPLPGQQMVQIKKCLNCGGIVPDDVEVGGKCPHCGAFFAYEQDASGKVVKRAPIGTYWTVGGSVPVIAMLIGMLFRYLRKQ